MMTIAVMPNGGGGERMIDFLLTCAAVVAFLMGIVTVAGFVVTLALVIKYWRR